MMSRHNAFLPPRVALFLSNLTVSLKHEAEAMFELPVVIGIFIVSLATLVKTSNFFTIAAEKLGRAMGLPPFIIGVTIVSIGTSIPELLSSVVAVWQGVSEIVVSNAVGSNIANICLVVGTAAVISVRSLQVTYDLLSVDLPIFTGSALLLALISWDHQVSTGEALLLLLGYIMYLFYTLKSGAEEEEAASAEEADGVAAEPGGTASSYILRQLLILIASGVFLFLGATYTIDSLIKISKILQIGEEIIAVSAVALGTSLPELVVTISAARQGKAGLAIGNALGSNVFNIFVVVGLPGLMGTLTVPDTILLEAVPVMIVSTLVMFFAIQDRKLTIWEGWLFYILYAWFIGRTFHVL